MKFEDPLQYIQYLNLDVTWVNVLVLTAPLVLGCIVGAFYFGYSLRKKKREATEFNPIYNFEKSPKNQILLR